MIKIAWYDLTNVIQPIRSVFASPDGGTPRLTATVEAGKTGRSVEVPF